MDDPLAVRVRDRIARSCEPRQEREPIFERGGVVDHAIERAARDQLHREERLARWPAPGLVDRDDAGMLEPRGDQRLALETRELVARGIEQLLERDRAAEPAIFGGDDATHPAARDLVVGPV